MSETQMKRKWGLGKKQENVTHNQEKNTVMEANHTSFDGWNYQTGI